MLLNFAAAAHWYDHATAQIILTVLITVLIQLAVRESIGKIVRRLVKTHTHETKLEEEKRENTLIRVFRTALAVMLWIIAGVIILGELHINVAALLTGAGLVGVIVGLGAQNVIKDYLAGLYIIIENQYRVGDVVTLDGLGITGGVSGVVEDISIRITKLRDLDGNLHFVRNGLAGVISNRTFQFANVNIDVAVSYQADVDEVEAVINRTGVQLAQDPKWQSSVVEPIQFLRIDSFNESAVVIKSVGRVKPAAQWDVAGEFRRRIKKAFEQAHIDIALPNVVVHEAKPKR